MANKVKKEVAVDANFLISLLAAMYEEGGGGREVPT